MTVGLMQKGDLLFVYGTLRLGERADLSSPSNQYGCSYFGEDKVNGLMYSLGGFPGLKTQPLRAFDDNSPAVAGDVFEILDSSITHALDAYEGYPTLYDRFQTTAASGLPVWVYNYQQEIADTLLIASGDWKQRIRLGVYA